MTTHPAAHAPAPDRLVTPACGCGGRAAVPVQRTEADTWHAAHLARAAAWSNSMPPEIAWALRPR